ncbi:MAG: DMT family transporter [Legionellales bacterium]|nr:DMT family transporter [Legionellales bacterium]
MYYYIIASLSIVLWGILPTVVKFSINDLNVSSFLVLRFFVSTVLLIWVLPSLLKKRAKLNKNFLLLFLAIVAVLFVSQTLALRFLSVTTYIVAFTLTPLLTLLILRYKLSRKACLGVFLAVTGSLVFFYRSGNVSLFHINYIAIFLMFLGMISWVFYTLVISKLHKNFNDFEIVALTNYLALFSSIIFWFLNGLPVDKIPNEIMLASLLSGGLIPLAFIFFSIGLRHVASFTITIQYLEPIFGLIFAYLFLHETLDKLQIVGSIMVIIGIGFISRYSQSHNLDKLKEQQ